MRWDDLFADLAAEAAALDLREQDLEIAERTRMERAGITVAARLAAGRGHGLELQVEVLGAVAGELERVTAQWLLLSAGTSQWLVTVGAVLGVRGLPDRADTGGRGVVAARLGWGPAWRVLARDRADLHVVRRDGSTLDAVAERVGADHVELGRPGRGQRELVPFEAVVAVRCPRL